MTSLTKVHQLKITLRGTKPPVWRRVLIAGDSTLADLHDVIQAAFGWFGYHLHEFEIDGVRYGVPDDDEDWGEPPSDERGERLDQVAPEGARFTYVYDFGGDWIHAVEVEKVLPSEVDAIYPACIAGRRAVPPKTVEAPGDTPIFSPRSSIPRAKTTQRSSSGSAAPSIRKRSMRRVRAAPQGRSGLRRLSASILQTLLQTHAAGLPVTKPDWRPNAGRETPANTDPHGLNITKPDRRDATTDQKVVVRISPSALTLSQVTGLPAVPA